MAKANGDQIWFMANNTKCVFAYAMAFMTYQAYYTNDWVITDSTMSPLNLKEGKHYQLCYYIAATGAVFNLY
jgi:hypothetical protein